jgi:hypothetical protein
MHDERNQSGDEGAEVVERRESAGASDTKQLPCRERGGYGEKRRKGRSSVQHDGDRDWSRDHPKEHAPCELRAHTSMISASFALINSSILWM